MTNEQLKPRVHKKTESVQMSLGYLSYESMLAEQAKRRRIALDVHNEIVKDLVFCNLRLGFSAKSEPAAELRGALEEVQCLVQLMIQKVRMISSEISPTLLYDLGLRVAIEEMLRETRRKYGIKYYLEEDGGSETLDRNIRVFLYESVCELVNNVIKHARAESVIVRIERNDDDLAITVEDDGAGFDPETLNNGAYSGGIGLVSLRERLSHLGGYLDIESTPEVGTRVTILLPVEKASSPATP